MVVPAVVGFLARLAFGIGLALVFAFVLALVRDDSSFAESFRVSVWIVGALMLLLSRRRALMRPRARARSTRGWRPLPRLVPRMAESSTTTVSPTALFVLTALTLFGIGIALG